MKRILFVDDEPHLLEGVQRMFRARRREWEMSFVSSGDAALAQLATGPYDVIVTDMRMPGMDGATLLEFVHDRYPSVVRVVLSGHVEMETALRAAAVAHQFLTKPCEPEKLREAIEHACECRSQLADEGIRRVIGGVGRLPALPDTCASLFAAFEDPQVDLARVGKIIERDVGITAKVLHLVNSAFFGLRHEVTSVRMAVNCLGLETLKQVVLSVEILRTFQPPPMRGFSLAEFEAHSQLTARIASRLPAPAGVGSHAVIAALLHDAGKLVLASRLPGQFEQAMRASRESRAALYAVEKELIGASHAEVGAYLLDLWRLPKVIVEATRRHHEPFAADPPGHEFDTPAITHVADALAQEVRGGGSGEGTAGSDLLDTNYVAALGMAEQLPVWRSLARQAFEEEG